MTPIMQRVPFNVAISDDRMLRKLWRKFSVPQQTILLAAYGIELPSDEHKAAWAILNGSFEHDKLGYPTKIFNFPYVAQNYDTVVGLIGRRSGKSYITCFAILYEVIFGGHLSKVNEGEEVVIPYLAQDLSTARKNMKMVALMAKQIKTIRPALTNDQNKDVLEFFGGLIKVQIEPPKVRTGRGWAMPIAIMDEVGFWYKASENADPDYEVQASIIPSQLQFAPHNKLFVISSPYTEEGILYKYNQGGTNGRLLGEDHEESGQFQGTLVVNAPTAAMGNPKFDPSSERKFLEKELARDPDMFTREYLAKFVSSVNGFITPDLVKAATDVGIKERKPDEVKSKNWRLQFVSAMDPAFRHDSFAYSVFHRNDDGTVVQDFLKVWTPDRKLGITLNPNEILDEIAQFNRQWGIKVTYSDQYQLESLQQIAMKKGFNIQGNDFTGKSKPKMYGSLLNLFRTNKIRLLDKPIIFQQLTKLIKKLTPMGGTQIHAPSGMHDDVASVIALGVECAIQLYPTRTVEKPEPTMWDICTADMRRKRKIVEDGWSGFDSLNGKLN